jgi:predicted phage terminase large subunit-like protein
MLLKANDGIALDRELASRGLRHFIPMGWDVLEPGTPYQHGWHIDAMSDHLEAVARGEITRLLINVPPGTMKSTTTSVFFPAWLWGPAAMPHMRFIGAAHEQTLATRDNRRTRLLIESEWFQHRWPTKMISDQNEKTYFENEKRGFRQSSSVVGITGKRGHILVWDDPHNPEGATSDPQRETTIRIFQETLPLRLVDPKTSGIIIVMQRLHQRDVSGFILEHDLGYEHLMLPMEFEPDRKCYTSIGFEDPRTEEGELLFEARFPREVVERDKRALGSYGAAGQFQQTPVPRGGGMFKRDWFEIRKAAPAGCRWVRAWDLAASKEKSSAYTVGLKMGETPDGTFVIADVTRFQGTSAEVERTLRNTATQDGYEVRGSIPKDPGAGGKAWATALIKAVKGYRYRATPETGDKVTRAEGLAAQAEAGNVFLIEGDWNTAFLDEVASFPMGRYADQVDAASRAFMELNERGSFSWNVDGEQF